MTDDIPVTLHREGEEPIQSSIRNLIVGLKPYVLVEFDPLGEDPGDGLAIEMQFGGGVGPDDLLPLFMTVIETLPTLGDDTFTLEEVPGDNDG